jgi:hypothetical protein
MTTEAKIRNGLHIYVGAIIAYKLLSYTIIDFDEVGQFLIKMISCGLLGLVLGAMIEFYQVIIGQKYQGLGDIGLTGLGGLVGGLLCVADQHITFVTTWLFYFALLIFIAEIVRSLIVKYKK